MLITENIKFLNHVAVSLRKSIKLPSQEHSRGGRVGGQPPTFLGNSEKKFGNFLRTFKKITKFPLQILPAHSCTQHKIKENQSCSLSIKN